VAQGIITKKDKTMDGIDVDDTPYKIWIGRVVKRLIEAEMLRWKELEEEGCQSADMHWQSAFENVQSRSPAG